MTTKLYELILYVADKSRDDPHFGLTKLHKILFDADFAFYRQHGRSIANESYQKLEFGPAVRTMMPTIKAAEKAGDLRVEWEQGDYLPRRVIPIREADKSGFTQAEIAAIDAAIAKLKDMNAKQVSDMSHKFIGWQLADLNEIIPFDAVHLLQEPLTDVERAMAWEVRTAI